MSGEGSATKEAGRVRGRTGRVLRTPWRRRLSSRTACRRVIALAAVTATLSIAGPATASAHDTAEGKCEGTGEIAFAKPLGPTPKQISFTDYAVARCTGTVNGEFMRNERMRLRAEGTGLLGCGTTRATSSGVMRYTRNTRTREDDVRIHYTARSQGSFGQIVSYASGRVSGTIVASVRFQGDQETLSRCAAGKLRQGTYDMNGRTITPIVG